MTVLEAIQRSSEFLERKGVESPRLQSELLLAAVLKLPRMQLYLKFERVLDDAETALMREFVRRRGQREPLQQIVGSTSFCGLEIRVNRQVLVPRPETELLAEQGWMFLKSLAQTGAGVSALDWGTGSGCIAVALAVNCPGAHVTAADTSPEALELASQNATANKVRERVAFLKAAALSDLPPGVQFDLVISNPPYIPSAEIQQLEPEVRDFEPRIALDGGEDGLDWPRRFALEGKRLLKPGGKLMIEFGDGQAPGVRCVFEEQKWVVEAILEDYNHRPRILVTRCP